MNENKKINLISLLNDIQNYIIYLICVSFIIYENELNNEQKQKMLFKNIFFNIKLIINHLKDKNNKQQYLLIFHNIIKFLAIINNINQNAIKKIKEFLIILNQK